MEIGDRRAQGKTEKQYMLYNCLNSNSSDVVFRENLVLTIVYWPKICIKNFTTVLCLIQKSSTQTILTEIIII